MAEAKGHMPPPTPAGRELLQRIGEGEWDAALDAIDSGAAAVDERGLNGLTALMLACREGDSEMVHELLNRGADPDARNLNGQSCLHQTTKVLGGRADVTRILLDAGADGWAPNDQCIPVAAVAEAMKDAKVAEVMAEYAAMPRCDMTQEIDRGALLEGNPPLLHSPSTWHQWPEVCRALAEKGERLGKAELLAPDATGTVPLERAVECRAFAAVEETLRRQGEPLGAQDMLQDGALAGWMEKLAATRQLAQAFDTALWQGKSAGELGAVYNALDGDMRAQVPNYYQLRHELAQDAQQQQGVGR